MGEQLAKERAITLSELVTRLIAAEWEEPLLPTPPPSPGFLKRLRNVAYGVQDTGDTLEQEAKRRKKK